MEDHPYKTWKCWTCGYVYEEAVGASDAGLAPETRWEDVPADWTCPECGAPKTTFELAELEF